MNRITRTLATVATTAVACVGVILAGAPAQAAPAVAPSVAAPFGQGNLVQMWHQPHDGYHWWTDTGAVRFLPRVNVWKKAYCHDEATGECMEYIRDYYHGLLVSWRTFNREVWTAAASLPACDDSGADCVAPTWGGLTRVRIGGEDFYAQTSTKP